MSMDCSKILYCVDTKEGAAQSPGGDRRTLFTVRGGILGRGAGGIKERKP